MVASVSKRESMRKNSKISPLNGKFFFYRSVLKEEDAIYLLGNTS